MKVALTHGFFLSADEAEQKIMRPYPPLGLLYISAYLDQQQIDHDVFDSTFRSMDELFAFLTELKPDYLGIYVNFLTRINVVKMINRIRSEALLKNMKMILGGPDVRYHAENYLKQGADFIVVGEGEETFYELISALDRQTEINHIAGLIYKDHDSHIQTGERAHIRDLDTLPFPNRQKIDLSVYLNAWKQKYGYSSITISTQRGCPFTCNWCSHAVFGDTYRRRSPQSVMDELEILMNDYHPDSFWFVDDVFTMSERWVNEFTAELEKRNLKIAYECISRADKLNEDIILNLKKSGCRTLWIGAESGSQKIIDRMDRRVDVMRVREMLKLTRQHGIEAGTFIMLGYPDEKISDINETIRHLKESNPDTFTINLAYPIKGTRLYEDVEDQIISNMVWAEVPDREIDFIRTYKRSFYDFAIRKVYNEVYAHKFYLKREYLYFARFKLKSMLAGFFMMLTK
ncbi:MAG: B12-binding domain-containing radical SAM protein [Bacteroidales bacterium]|nr:B12-binding domain-containing radical SAM protein [Bacteroidales bacterium]